ncbi:MAG TPA: hypothetical protein ENF67_01415, partial [Candidatus Pacearchaeota archaeon]|nr:hypothetical protein [Candidatus Pacearchaeota archaeon]
MVTKVDQIRKEIKKKAEKEKREARFDGRVSIEEREVIVDPSTRLPQKNSFAGGIDPKTKEVEIQYKREYAEKKPKKAENTVIDIGRHEITHVKGDRRVKQGCPGTLEKHIAIYEAVSEVLMSKGYNQFDVQYIVNAFEDFIDNINLSDRFDIKGLIWFYEDVGENSESLVEKFERMFNVKVKTKKKPKYSEFYEAFVKLQAMFWNNPKKRILNKYYTHKPEIKETLENFLERSGLNQLKTKINVNGKEVEVRDRKAMLNYLNNEERWPELAKIFAEEFSKLMQPGYALPIPGLGGAGTRGRENEVEVRIKVKKKKSGDEDEEESEEEGIDWDSFEGGNYFDREMKDPEKRKEQAWKDFNKGKKRPNWLNYYEALDAVYERLARRLNIKAEVFTRTTKMPITWYGKRDFDPERDKPKHLTFGFNEKGEVVLKKKRWHHDMNLEYKVAEKGFPEVRFVMIDTSGSMKENPNGGDNVGDTSYIPWGINSKYHYALLAWYGFVEYLRQNYLLKKTTISLANFSDVTALARGLEQAKKLALKPQFGDTYIDID